MPSNSLKRARRFGRPAGSWWSLQAAAVLSSLLTALLILNLGLLTELLVTRGAPTVPDADRASLKAWAEHNGIDLDGDRGLLPLVLRRRDGSVLGPCLLEAYTRFGPLRSNRSCLFTLIAGGVLLAILESLTLLVVYLAVQRAAAAVAVRLTAAVRDQAFCLGAADLLQARPSRPERLLTENIEQVRLGLVAWWRAVPRSVVLLLVLILLAMLVDVWLTVATILLAAVITLLVWRLRSRARRRRQRFGDLASAEHAHLTENLRLAPLVAGYTLDKVPGEPFDRTLRRYRDAALRSYQSDVFMTPAIVLFGLVGTGLILLLVGVNVLRDPPNLTLSGTVVLGASLLCAYFPIARMRKAGRPIGRGDRAAAGVFVYLDRDPNLAVPSGAARQGPLVEAIRLESVTLADHHGRKLLDGASLEIPARGRFAVIASDPAAAMASAGLLVRLYDPAAGRICFDGRDISSVTLASLREQAKLVTGDAVLLTGTVLENIGCGSPDFTEIEIIDAAKRARAYNFIQQLPQGFATVIGQHGARLEPGPVFRIALARAVLRNPSVFVIEEPGQPIDEKSAGYIDEVYRSLAAEHTLIVFPTRLDTLRSAEHVYVLHEGKLHVDGTHEELLKSSDLYRHLIYLRFNPFRNRVSP